MQQGGQVMQGGQLNAARGSDDQPRNVKLSVFSEECCGGTHWLTLEHQADTNISELEKIVSELATLISELATSSDILPH